MHSRDDHLPEVNLIINRSTVFTFKKSEISIGRSDINDLVIADPYISRAHAKLRFKEGHYEIEDLDSTAGTFINKKQIKKCLLTPGDAIRLANFNLIFGQEGFPAAENSSLYQPSPLEESSAYEPQDFFKTDRVLFI